MLIYDMGAAKTAATVVELIALEDKDQKEQVRLNELLEHFYKLRNNGIQTRSANDTKWRLLFRIHYHSPTN